MNQEDTVKEISTKDWYDFIGHLGEIIPALHLGGKEATNDLLEMCNLSYASHVLDVGCGTGFTACEIAKKFGSKVIGIDISETMISKAIKRARKEQLLDKVEFRVASVFNLPFENDFFDVAIFESVLTPLSGNKSDALKEIIRVISPEGIVGANESYIIETAPKEFWQLAKQHPATQNIFTPDSLKALFEKVGLDIQDISIKRSSKAPSAMKELGVTGLISFMLMSYWKVLAKIITDSRFRKAANVDEQISKFIIEHGGYILIIGQKSENKTRFKGLSTLTIN
jgi:ubiquinone/menaquinone biosynthesis C-methylase UbiE